MPSQLPGQLCAACLQALPRLRAQLHSGAGCTVSRTASCAASLITARGALGGVAFFLSAPLSIRARASGLCRGPPELFDPNPFLPISSQLRSSSDFSRFVFARWACARDRTVSIPAAAQLAAWPPAQRTPGGRWLVQKVLPRGGGAHTGSACIRLCCFGSRLHSWLRCEARFVEERLI